jgi:hypothetical protein
MPALNETPTSPLSNGIPPLVHGRSSQVGVAHLPDPLLRSSWQGPETPSMRRSAGGGPVPNFTAMLEQYSWCTVKVDLSSLQFFHRYVLDREMEWIKIIRPPRVRTLPDIPTREEVQLLINKVRKLRYRIFLLVVYSLGLRIKEGLPQQVADSSTTVNLSAALQPSGSFWDAGTTSPSKRQPLRQA